MILVNGEAVNSVSAFDRGLAYGDGVFETIAVVEGELEYWEPHYRRLSSGCQRLGFQPPTILRLQEDAERILNESDALGVLKIVITRGEGGRGYKSADHSNVTRVISSHSAPNYPAEYASQGIALHLCNTPLGCNPILAGMKHLNRLEQVMARQEWSAPAVAEGLMLSFLGNVIEGVMSNLFWVKNGRVYTPDLSQCGVAGIMRGRILDLCPETVQILSAPLPTLFAADEVFMSNSLMGIWPVVSLADQRWSVGPITRQLQQKIQKDRVCSRGFC